MFYRTNIIGSKALFVLYSKVITKISGIQVVKNVSCKVIVKPGLILKT